VIGGAGWPVVGTGVPAGTGARLVRGPVTGG